MANKSNSKNSKSNKTAHVLNLLSGAGSGPEAAKAQNHPQAVPATPAPDNSEAVSEAIRNALEEDLLAELEASEPAPQPEEDFQPFQPENVSQPQPQPAPATHEAPPEPAPAAEAQPDPPTPAPQPEPAPAAEAQPEPTPAPHPEPAPAPAEAQPESHGQKGEVTYINVMQTLVEDKADKYIQRTHMCTCNRCRTDVIALTLSSLPAKYIVVPENESIPMLSVYEGRYEAAITAQLMWACQKVAAHPRHTANSDGSMRLGAPRKKD